MAQSDQAENTAVGRSRRRFDSTQRVPPLDRWQRRDIPGPALPTATPMRSATRCLIGAAILSLALDDKTLAMTANSETFILTRMAPPREDGIRRRSRGDKIGLRVRGQIARASRLHTRKNCAQGPGLARSARILAPSASVRLDDPWDAERVVVAVAARTKIVVACPKRSQRRGLQAVAGPPSAGGARRPTGEHRTPPQAPDPRRTKWLSSRSAWLA